MNINSLREKLNATITAELCGETVTLRRISARDGMLLNDLLVKMPVNELGQPIAVEDMTRFYAFAISKSLTEGGALPFDSDEGRETLERLPLLDMVAASERALEFSGMAEEPGAKKNSPPTSDSPSSSASPLESSTPTS